MSAFNGSGTFVISGTGLPYVTATVISSTVANQLNTDLATGLSNCLTKDGQTVPINNIPMGGFRLTGLGAAVAPGDALVWGQPATVSDPFNITHDQNGPTAASINNSDPGAAAQAFWQASNTGSVIRVGQCGANFTPSGLLFQGASFLTSSANLVVGVTSPGAIIFGTNNIEKMRLDTNGLLGIGVIPPVGASPAYKAIYLGATSSFIGTGGNSSGMIINSYWDGTNNIQISNQASSAYYAGGTGWSWYLAPASAAGTLSGFTLKMGLDTGGLRINATTNVLVGNESLSVNGVTASMSYYCSDNFGVGSYHIGTVGAFLGRNTANGDINWFSPQGAMIVQNVANGVFLPANGSAWQAISSRLDKRDFTPIPGDPFAIIMGHEASLYRYITDADDAPLRPGLYFEDAIALYPYAAFYEPEHDFFDEPTGEIHIAPERKGLSLEQYVPLLMAAFQKQIALNATVDARLTAGGL